MNTRGNPYTNKQQASRANASPFRTATFCPPLPSLNTILLTGDDGNYLNQFTIITVLSNLKTCFKSQEQYL